MRPAGPVRSARRRGAPALSGRVKSGAVAKGGGASARLGGTGPSRWPAHAVMAATRWAASAKTRARRGIDAKAIRTDEAAARPVVRCPQTLVFARRPDAGHAAHAGAVARESAARGRHPAHAAR